MGGFIIANTSGLAQLLNKLPTGLREKLIQLSSLDKFSPGKIEFVVLFGENKNIVKSSVESIGGSFEDLGYGYGIITINVLNLDKISQIKGVSYLELPKTLYTSDINSNKASCVNELWDIYKLTGEGVVIGFVDTGIDYTHPGFRKGNGDTRIKYIYDLAGGAKLWTEDQINQALKSQNPYSIVPERDDSGHGTHVAGIACAGGNIERRYYGAAYNSSIIMVKITPPGKVNFTQSTQIMRGIKFLLDKRRELGIPLAINLSLSTNDGAHNGSSILEQYISTVCNAEPITFVIAAGNEGEAGHHVGGVLREKQSISINIAPDERGIILQLYKGLLSDISLEIINPTGVSSGVINVKQGYKDGLLSKDRYIFYNTGPKPFDMDGEIVISLIPDMQEVLIGGQWILNIYLNNDSPSNYDIWMPISEGLNPKTRFLQPNVYNTLGIPATVENVVSVGSYNHLTNNISAFSGRGALERPRIIKPDLVSPGELIESTVPDGGFDTKTGTSMATPEVTGICALLMEWGMVKGNDIFLYGERLKYYLLKGSRRNRPNTIYPNPTWGYGEVCANGAMELLISNRGEGLDSMKRQEKDCGSLYIDPNYNNYIVEYDGDIEGRLKAATDVCAFILDDNYAIVSLKSGKEQEVFKTIPEIVYVENPSIYTLSQVSPIEAANISQFHKNPYLTLNGQGVLVGMLDTGIDYLNTEFIYEDDTTRVDRIWDQTIQTGTKPKGFNFGSEYTRESINKAIEAKKQGKDPYAIVPSKDEVGHGTSMAGVIGGRGKDPELIGAAPSCEFVVVKLKPIKRDVLDSMNVPDKVQVGYNNTEIILGIKYLVNIAKELNKPMVIYIPLGTNMGSHDGNSIIERYIDDLSKTRGLVVVTGTGNQGDSDTHASGTILKTGDVKTIELKVSNLQQDLSFEIWISKPDKVSLEIVSPSGEVIEKIPVKLKEPEEIQLVFEGSSISVRYFMPEELTGDELIRVRIKNIKEGIWQFRLIGDYIANGRYNAWLPQRELLKGDTRFLSPNQYTTLTIPSTSRYIITTAFYNQNNNSYVAESGRGYTRDGRVKPEVASGGVNVKTTKVGGGSTTVSGSSVATAVLAGACALILQWGIVEGRDKTLYAQKIKTYLIRGTAKRPGDVYPNPEWGYGMLNLQGIFENMRGLEEEKEYIEYTVGGLFVRIPFQNNYAQLNDKIHII